MASYGKCPVCGLWREDRQCLAVIPDDCSIMAKGGNPAFGHSISDKAKSDIDKINRAAKRF
jgi:hypothetical protein